MSTEGMMVCCADIFDTGTEMRKGGLGSLARIEIRGLKAAHARDDSMSIRTSVCSGICRWLNIMKLGVIRGH